MTGKSDNWLAALEDVPENTDQYRFPFGSRAEAGVMGQPVRLLPDLAGPGSGPRQHLAIPLRGEISSDLHY